jgi:DNA-binding NtrC family response regulator
MMISPFMERFERRETVLLAAPEPAVFSLLSAELTRRGAEVVAAADIEGAAEAVRARSFDAVYVAGRDSADATLLLMRLVQGRAGQARLMLVVDALSAHRFAQALPLAEETMTFALSAPRMADAAGIGFQRQAAFG